MSSFYCELTNKSGRVKSVTGARWGKTRVSPTYTWRVKVLTRRQHTRVLKKKMLAWPPTNSDSKRTYKHIKLLLHRSNIFVADTFFGMLLIKKEFFLCEIDDFFELYVRHVAGRELFLPPKCGLLLFATYEKKKREFFFFLSYIFLRFNIMQVNN